jgi:DNA-binding transcriptional regulator YiaG
MTPTKEDYNRAIQMLLGGFEIRRVAFSKIRQEILHMPQVVFCSFLGVTAEQVSRWENGHREIPDVYQMALIGHLCMWRDGLIPYPVP